MTTLPNIKNWLTEIGKTHKDFEDFLWKCRPVNLPMVLLMSWHVEKLKTFDPALLKQAITELEKENNFECTADWVNEEYQGN